MSRSRYVWLATGRKGVPVAVFTVRHECAAWIDRQPLAVLADLGVCRITDNGLAPHDVVWLNPGTLEAAI